MPVVTENEADKLRGLIRKSLWKQSQERTVAPRDHMSVCGPHLRFSMASGLLNIGAPIA